MNDTTTKKQVKNEKAVVFIDGNNFRMGLHNCFNMDGLDLESFCSELVMNRCLTVVYYADANYIQDFNPTSYRIQQSYFTYIKKWTMLKFRKGFYNPKRKVKQEKLSDVYLATDMVDLCLRDKFDIAYIISGDADLSPAVSILKRERKKIINVYFDKPPLGEVSNLRGVCENKFIEITKSRARKHEWIYKKKATPG